MIFLLGKVTRAASSPNAADESRQINPTAITNSRFTRCSLPKCLALAALALHSFAPLSGAADSPTTNAPAPPARPPSKFKDFGEVTRGTTKYDGLFTLYRTNETLYAEIKPQQLNQPLIAPMAIARGLASAGQPLNFGDEWILVFRRVDDKIQVVRRNIHYQAPKGTPLQKAVEQNYTDSVLMALPIVSINPGTQGVLVDFGQIFLTDFANLGFGSLDRNRSTWHKIKTFENNIELQVEVTFGGGRFASFGFGDSGVVDPRGLTLVVHYSLAKTPDSGYKPRIADHRVGYFLNATKDFGSSDPDTYFVRYVNRWRLEKADPKAKLSPPKKQIVWWVEDNVPHEFRPAVEEGILEWNKAFERIGFKNAIGVRWQNERDEFDPEDINYCTFRWITTSSTFAMSALRSNPLTGEMIDGDVIFDASWIRVWKNQYALLVGTAPVAEGESDYLPIAVGEIISPIMAMKEGFGLPFPIPGSRGALKRFGHPDASAAVELVPAEWSPVQRLLARRSNPAKFTACQCVASKSHEFSMAAIALAAAGKTDPDGDLPEEFLNEAIKEVVMHEVGHSLGLRHNFKASTMLRPDQINDPEITRVKGMSGSVMDYNPINIAKKGEKQGQFASTTIGPYDYWAIEYAYKPIEGDEKAELKKIAARSPDPELAFATDEDMYLSDDPYVNTYDLGSDPLEYGKQRMELAGELLKTIEEHVVRDGESWARLRQAFSTLLSQYGNAAYLAAGFIGGQSVSRDFKGEGSRDPIRPVSGDKQRSVLKFLVDNVLTDKNFEFSPSLLRRLSTEYWYHWGSQSLSGPGMDFPVYSRILAIQRIVLNRCFDGTIMARIQNQELQAEKGSNPIRLSEIFSSLTEGIWSELTPSEDGEKKVLKCSTIRRNLQREHLRRLCTMVLGTRRSPYADLYDYVSFYGDFGSIPADARSLARYHLDQIGKRIDKALGSNDIEIDDTTRAHLAECHQRINKVLESSYMAMEP